MCIGCRYWFPRPPIHFYKDFERVTRKLIQYTQDAWAGRIQWEPPPYWSLPPSPPLPGWKRFLRWLFWIW